MWRRRPAWKAGTATPTRLAAQKRARLLAMKVSWHSADPLANLLADGRYRFDGTDFQVALTEPSKGNAIHGLLRWRPGRWRPTTPTGW